MQKTGWTWFDRIAQNSGEEPLLGLFYRSDKGMEAVFRQLAAAAARPNILIISTQERFAELMTCVPDSESRGRFHWVEAEGKEEAAFAATFQERLEELEEKPLILLDGLPDVRPRLRRLLEEPQLGDLVKNWYTIRSVLEDRHLQGLLLSVEEKGLFSMELPLIGSRWMKQHMGVVLEANPTGDEQVEVRLVKNRYGESETGVLLPRSVG